MTTTVPEKLDTKHFPAIPAIDRAMQPFVDKGELSGAVTLLADGKNILHCSALGQRDLARHLPMQTNTIFWIASMTKLITATAVMMMQDEGKLSANDPVSRFIPEFASLKTPSGKPANLTIRHIATHISGLAEASNEVMKSARTLSELIPSSLSQPMQFEPGKKWAYCQSGINTMGRIVEIVSGKRFENFVQDRIARPLGMTDTTFFLSKEQMPRVVQAYSLKSGKLEPAENAILPDSGGRNYFPAANGGLYGTPTDYVLFCQMLLNGGTLDGKKYLRPETIADMTSVKTEGIADVGFVPGSQWGLGFNIVDKPQDITGMFSRGTYGHGGAHGTQAWIDPVKQRIYILMIQRSDIGNSDASIYRKTFQQAAAG